MDSMVEVRAEAGYRVWSMGNRPVNALSPEFLAALESRLDEAVADPAVAAVVLTSSLKVFSAGGDAAWMARILREEGKTGLVDRFNQTMDAFRRVCDRLRRSPVLVIAALNGHTLAGGLELAAACDLRFCAESPSIQIGVPEMDLFGAVPSGGGGAQYLARLLGPSQALEFILDAKPVSPDRALEMGLVNRLAPESMLLEQAEKFASDVARKAGRIGVSAAKRMVLGGFEMPMSDALDFDRAVHWDAMRRGNFLSGVEAFAARFGAKNG